MKKKYLKLFNKPTIKAFSSVQVIKDKRQADSGHCGKQKDFSLRQTAASHQNWLLLVNVSCII